MSSSGRGVWYLALSTCFRKTTSGSGSGLNDIETYRNIFPKKKKKLRKKKIITHSGSITLQGLGSLRRRSSGKSSGRGFLITFRRARVAVDPAEF